VILITEDRGVSYRHVDESELIKRIDVDENDDIRIEATEYCLIGCKGNAHVTGVAQGDGSFCELHVHRSAHGIVKRWPEGMGAIAAAFV
jgi:hypothetical protein